MYSKKHLAAEAERLYIYSHLMISEIAKRLNLNRKTVMAWKEEFDWEKKRKDFLISKQSFHEELFEFARKIMREIESDMANGEEVNIGRFHAFCRMIPLLTKTKDYEDIIAKRETRDIVKGLSPDIVAQIEEDILGITPNDRTEENNEEE